MLFRDNGKKENRNDYLFLTTYALDGTQNQPYPDAL